MSDATVFSRCHRPSPVTVAQLRACWPALRSVAVPRAIDTDHGVALLGWLEGDIFHPQAHPSATPYHPVAGPSAVLVLAPSPGLPQVAGDDSWEVCTDCMPHEDQDPATSLLWDAVVETRALRHTVPPPAGPGADLDAVIAAVADLGLVIEELEQDVFSPLCADEFADRVMPLLAAAAGPGTRARFVALCAAARVDAAVASPAPSSASDADGMATVALTVTGTRRLPDAAAVAQALYGGVVSGVGSRSVLLLTVPSAVASVLCDAQVGGFCPDPTRTLAGHELRLVAELLADRTPGAAAVRSEVVATVATVHRLRP